jgi:hypothetical protein
METSVCDQNEKLVKECSDLLFHKSVQLLRPVYFHVCNIFPRKCDVEIVVAVVVRHSFPLELYVFLLQNFLANGWI